LRPNIYKLLENEFRIFDILLDIGCAGLCDLVDFENSPFKKLIGIDKEFATTPFGDYGRCKTKNLDLTEEQYRILSNDLIERFKQRYVIEIMDFLDYDFITNTNSLIICNKVFHFYSDEKKFELIKTFYTSLQADGMIYLKINHDLHPDYIDLNKTTRIGENIFQNNEVPGDIRYPVEPNKFIKQLNKNYFLLHDYTISDKKTLTIIIRK
jgi:hypothetical protein